MVCCEYISGIGKVNIFNFIRNYNEDRVSIILNISKPPHFYNGVWPKCSYFAIYDGHGGSACADFLRDNLHNYVITEPNFPTDVKAAIKNGFLNAENDYINKKSINKVGDITDKSGSCAIVVFLVDDICYSANVGDSRAIMSVDNGKEINILSIDHKPDNEEEKKRIIMNGGRVYQNHNPINQFGLPLSKNCKQLILGPARVYPGRLSVSRSFGDVEAKKIELGGNPYVVTAMPEIKAFPLNEKTDFIILGCDGIFDQIQSEEAIEAVWKVVNEEAKNNNDIHQICILSVDLIMKTTLLRKTYDNITLLIIAFENFEKKVKEIFDYQEKSNNQNKLLKSNEFLNSTNSILRFETENNIITNRKEHPKKNILDKETLNIKNNNTNATTQEFISFNYKTDIANDILNKNNLRQSGYRYFKEENKNSNLKNLIKNQIESKYNNISRSVNKNKILSNDPIIINRDITNNSNENYSEEQNRNSIIIPLIDTKKKFSGNSLIKQSENKNDFYQSLFPNEELNKDKDLIIINAITPQFKNDEIMPFKYLPLEKTKKIKLPIKSNSNFKNLGNFKLNN